MSYKTWSEAPTCSGSGTPPDNVQEFNIRVCKKKHDVMRFNAALKVDFGQWNNVMLERENNMKEFRSKDEDMPKFGAGSEYKRDQREELRRKKLGIFAKKYRPEAQPWILKEDGKKGKKFKGIRDGGVNENAAYYVFTTTPDGTIKAYPLNEWYNFQPIQRYKSLTAEEAEEEFSRRKRTLNYHSLMMRKRLRANEGEEQDPDEVKIKGARGAAKKSKELKISEMDDWIDSDEKTDSDEDEDDKKKSKEDDSDDDAVGKGMKGKGKSAKAAEKKKKNRDVDNEAFEESDDGDEEGREMDYETESSDDELDPESKIVKDLKSVAEEEALLSSESEEEEEKENKSDKSDDEEKNKKEKNKEESSKNSKNKKKTKQQSKDDKNKKCSPTSTSSTNKRKMNNMPSDFTDSKNGYTSEKCIKLDMTAPSLPSIFPDVMNERTNDDYCISEEAVRRYLMRKPMTASELLAKFKNKTSDGLSSRLVNDMTSILKNIHPVKQTIKGKIYFSIKSKR